MDAERERWSYLKGSGLQFPDANILEFLASFNDTLVKFVSSSTVVRTLLMIWTGSRILRERWVKLNRNRLSLKIVRRSWEQSTSPPVQYLILRRHTTEAVLSAWSTLLPFLRLALCAQSVLQSDLLVSFWSIISSLLYPKITDLFLRYRIQFRERGCRTVCSLHCCIFPTNHSNKRSDPLQLATKLWLSWAHFTSRQF